MRQGLQTVAAAALALALAACNPGGGGGGGGGPPVIPGWALGGVTFDPALAGFYRTSTEFLWVDADFVSGPLTQAHPYALINVHWAHSASLTGAGQLVALVDSGILLTHQEFAGKTIHTFGSVLPADHGTQVASLIAGARNGVGMHGVAPGADLHITWLGTPTLPIATLIAGTLDAANRGAIAQNNSWTFNHDAGQLAGYLQTFPGQVAAGLNASLGYGTANWQAYINAFNTFQQTGVIVWAQTNTAALTNGDIMAALPYFEPSLREAWITVVNGYFEVDGTGKITHAELLSAPCAYAARFCIAADGTTYAADATANNGYTAATGTSFAAPQVSGSIALLAQAFPSLNPQELTNRLLASADNSWFASQGVIIDGTVNFGGGIVHGYSTAWGHGTVNLQAALSPIGGVAVMAGGNVATAPRIPLAQSGIAVPPAFGDAFAAGLAAREMAVFDHFNGNFGIDAADLARAVPATQLAAITGAIRPRPATLGVSAAGGPQLTATNDVVAAAYGSGGDMSRASALSLSGRASVVSAEARAGRFGLSLYGYAGGQRAAADTVLAGFGVAGTVEAAGGRLALGFGQNLEQGAFLGIAGNAAFDFGAGTAISTTHVSYERDFGPRVLVFAGAEVGVAHALGFSGNGLVRDIGPVTFSGFNFGATVRGVLSDDDSLTFSLTRPMRVASGTMELALPVGRTVAGAIVTEPVAVALAPSGRQVDLGLSYTLGLGASSQLRLAGAFSLDAGNVAGARALTLAAGYTIGF